VTDESPYPSLPTDEKIAAARECARALTAHLQEGSETQQLEILDEKGVPERLDIPVTALKVLAEMLCGTGEGNAVRIVPMPADLSVIQASRIFGISHSVLMDVLEKGEVPSYTVGSRRRVLYTDMVEYDRRREAARERAREEFLRQIQVSGSNTAG